ncbi:histidine utilization repressor [Afifella sp. IM 167]|uniref:histidine utilization repressor n=1 Tax=Afifella sp. IM 167 TaxID=2033586 RepID=UPI001CCDDA46|nr:histidine utilization repressor [Afifella sp. IM 167]MBZ8132887.1 histidine utilization repressor [Afifella sp. IM 167]
MNPPVGRAPLKLDGTGPLHDQIRRAVAAPILSGVWKPGERVPPEMELMEVFGASRMTVNRALRALADQGLIARRRRAGSFVAIRAGEHAVTSIGDIRRETEARGETYGYELLLRRESRVSAMMSLASGVSAGTPVLHLNCRHLAAGRPAVLEDRWINLAVVPEALHGPFDHDPPGPWLLANVPFTEGEHRIAAIRAGATAARLLAMRPDEPCLSVERRTWRGKEMITFASFVYPGSSHVLSGKFSSRS